MRTPLSTRTCNELALHYSMGAALADADKAVHYCMAAGERALRLLAFEEAVVHFTRALDVAEQSGSRNSAFRCDALVALAEAQGKIGGVARADENLAAAVSLARAMGDPERLAAAALRAGPLSELGIGGASQKQIDLLEEARSALPQEDSHLRSMVTARLGLIPVYTTSVPAPGALERSLALNTEAVAMARRLGDRNALGYALDARLHALWGIEPAPERLATGKELGEIADDVGDAFLALHGHMWRVRELLAQGDVDAVTDEITRYASRGTGPVHPLEASHLHNVSAMMALVSGDVERGTSLGGQALEMAAGYNELAQGFNAALMIWTWWQRDELGSPQSTLRQALAHAPEDSPSVRAGFALDHAEAGETESSARAARLARRRWMGHGRPSERGRHPGPRGRHRRVHRHRRGGSGAAHLRADAAVCGDRHCGPPDRNRMSRPGRHLPRDTRGRGR